VRRGVAGGGHRQLSDEVDVSQVLARKYRPRSFDQLIGQDHVAQALTNAIANDRLHHAYLFVGTRGVGKTSIARILARCLNCETGPTNTPCLTCSPCQSIEAGRFVDLIEVDAASRTKVEDTRELLENVQYAPSEGRFKVYLIDEVHMLSAHSFNALLKTLEEPPAHVKFLLATTDPQKVPVTVLSRCLQFRLRDLPADRIAQHLASVLDQEGIAHEAPALDAIGRAARGSIRDAMTLTDQAIAFTNGQVTSDSVQSMLGIQGQDSIPLLIDALAQGDAPAALSWIEQVAMVDPDWSGLVEAIQRHLHDLAVKTALGEAQALSAEVIQLNYSLATQAYQELPLAPEPRLGFEMLVLRMLAFRPAQSGEYPEHAPPKSDAAEAASEPAAITAPSALVEPAPEASSPTPAPEPPSAVEPVPIEPAPTAVEPVAVEPTPTAVEPVPVEPVSQVAQTSVSPPWESEPEPPADPAPASPADVEPTAKASSSGQIQLDAEQFTDVLESSGLGGMALSTLRQGQVLGLTDARIQLRLPKDCETLFMDHHRDDALQALGQQLGQRLRGFEIEWGPVSGPTPNDVLAQRAAARLEQAKIDFSQEPAVQWLVDQFGAQIDESSVAPRSE